MPRALPLTLTPLRRIQALLLLGVCGAFPLAATLVFVAGLDRFAVAHLLASVYAGGLYAVLSAPWWPLRSLRRLRAVDRLHAMVFTWFWITYLTHVSWELAWVVFHDQIAAARDAAWAYAWWAYIDGGDLRYASDSPSLLMMEVLSVTNGVIGLTGLFLWFRRPSRRRLAVLLFLATAVVHLYSAALYYGSELLAGLPNVNTDSFYDVGVKFIGANSLWLIVPWFVIVWGGRHLLGPSHVGHGPRSVETVGGEMG